jgi:hypothetical protein
VDVVSASSGPHGAGVEESLGGSELAGNAGFGDAPFDESHDRIASGGRFEKVVGFASIVELRHLETVGVA